MLSLFPISVEVPLTPLPKMEAFSIICMRRRSAMDTARVLLNALPESVSAYLTAGSPIRVRWYSNGEQDEFVGYVHSLRQQSEGFRKSTVLILISAAYPLFDQSARSFRQVTIDQVAREICDDNRFQLDTAPHPVVIDQILQKSESDWTLLVRLAEQWGYSLLFDGVTMTFRPMQELLEDRYLTAEKFSTANSKVQSDARILSFKPTFSAAGATGDVRAEGSGVSIRTAETISWTASGAPGAFRQTEVEYPVFSELEGTMLGIGQDIASRFPYKAEATIRMPVKAKPLDVYQIAHNDSRMTWVVESVKHVVTGSNYIGEFVLGSDGKDYVPDNPRSGVDVAMLMRLSKSVDRATPVIINAQPYLVGTGVNVVVKDSRWTAEILEGVR